MLDLEYYFNKKFKKPDLSKKELHDKYCYVNEYVKVENTGRISVVWNRTECFSISKSQYNMIVDSLLEQSELWFEEETKSSKIWLKKNCWRTDKNPNERYATIYIGYNGGCYRFRSDSETDVDLDLMKSVQELKDEGNKKAYRVFQTKFKEISGVSIEKALGVLKKDDRKIFKERCANFLANTNPIALNSENKHVYKADIDSAYPYQTQHLPTCKDMLKFDKYISPEKIKKDYPEYKFAVYIKSNNTWDAWGHDTARQELYKNKWVKMFNSKKMNRQTFQFKQLDRDNEETILLKESEYSKYVYDTFKYFHNIKLDIKKIPKSQRTEEQKKLYQECKDVMNMTIGTFYVNDPKRPSMAHAALFILNRHVERMAGLMSWMEGEGNIPLVVAIDSVTWKSLNNTPHWFINEEPGLGNFMLEVNDQNCNIASSHNLMVFYDNEGNIDYEHSKHQAVGFGTTPVEEVIKKPDDIFRLKAAFEARAVTRYAPNGNEYIYWEL